jgi:Holliday junction DNA helicase RuvA
MISSVRGIVQDVADQELVLEVGGIGIQLAVPNSVLEQIPAVGNPFFLHTHLIVRQDALTLYGFSTQEEREIFLELLQVSGIGPRLGLAVLSNMSIDTLRLAIANNQPEAIVGVPGVGKKTAERLIFQLKDRIAFAPGEVGEVSEIDSEVLAVLTALGYSMLEAQSAIRSVESDVPESVEERVKLALQYFARP